MDAKNITKQVIAFQKQSFDNLQSIWDFTQAQTTETIDKMLEQALWVPPASRQAIDNWRSSMAEGRKQMNAYVDQSFDLYEKMLTINPVAAPASASAADDAK
jgi:hypothetical protein